MRVRHGRRMIELQKPRVYACDVQLPEIPSRVRVRVSREKQLACIVNRSGTEAEFCAPAEVLEDTEHRPSITVFDFVETVLAGSKEDVEETVGWLLKAAAVLEAHMDMCAAAELLAAVTRMLQALEEYEQRLLYEKLAPAVPRLIGIILLDYRPKPRRWGDSAGNE